MKKTLIYLIDSKKKRLQTKIVSVVSKSKVTSVTLGKTIFYPQGGGQPSDQGTIRGENGGLKVTNVVYNDGDPIHQGKLKGKLKEGDAVICELDWERRYYYMRLHSAGHLVHEVVHETFPELKPVRGEHGIGGKQYIEYLGNASLEVSRLNPRLQQLIEDGRQIKTYFVTLDQLKEKAQFVPTNLPKNKPLRVVEIEGFEPIPDGGTQVDSTKELAGAVIAKVETKKENILVHYQVERGSPDKKARRIKPAPVRHETTFSTPEVTAITDKEAIRSVAISAIALISDTKDLSELEDLRISYLGRKGKVNCLLKKLPTFTKDERLEFGSQVNELKKSLVAAIEKRGLQLLGKDDSDQAWVDLTDPGKKTNVGHLHLVTRAIEEITRIFEKIGFTRVRYPTVDWDWYPFEALNMAKDHPARDEWETFFIDKPPSADKKKGHMVLTPHTSNGQVREMERMGEPPIRMLNIASCFRRQQDVTHIQSFLQFEGLVIDRNISISHLKGVIDYFAGEFYGDKVVSRLRPFNFEFTEPSFEVDFTCPNCRGTTKVSGKKCRFCKGGWHEVGGAGMVHPRVLTNGGIDPDEYSGFAFGWGVERTYAMKPGININDIRMLHSTDIRILKQF